MSIASGTVLLAAAEGSGNVLAADPVLHGHRGRRHRRRGCPGRRQPSEYGRLDQLDCAADRVLFTAACGYLAAVYLVTEASRRGNRAMGTSFTLRAKAAAIVTGALSLTALVELRSSDPAFYSRLTGRALPLVLLAGAFGLAVLTLLSAGRPKGTGVIAALCVAAVIWGWGVAQYPALLPGTGLTLTNAGATQATYLAVTIVAIAAVILVVPSFALLYVLQGRRVVGDGEHGS